MTTLALNGWAAENSRFEFVKTVALSALAAVRKRHDTDVAQRHLRDLPDYLLDDIGIDRWEIYIATAKGAQDAVEPARPFGYFFYL